MVWYPNTNIAISTRQKLTESSPQPTISREGDLGSGMRLAYPHKFAEILFNAQQQLYQ